MTTSWKADQSKLSHEEAEMLKKTKQPLVTGLSGDELGALGPRRWGKAHGVPATSALSISQP